MSLVLGDPYFKVPDGHHFRGPTSPRGSVSEDICFSGGFLEVSVRVSSSFLGNGELLLKRCVHGCVCSLTSVPLMLLVVCSGLLHPLWALSFVLDCKKLLQTTGTVKLSCRLHRET